MGVPFAEHEELGFRKEANIRTRLGIRVVPWIKKDFDIFLPRSRPGLAPSLMANYIRAAAGHPPQSKTMGYKVIPSHNHFAESLSLTGILLHNASWEARYKANCNGGYSPLVRAFDWKNCLNLLKMASEASPLPLPKLTPTDEVSKHLRLAPQHAIFTETGWTYKAGETLVASFDF